MKIKLSSLLLLVALLLNSCGLQSDVTVLKLGHNLDTKHSVHLAMQHMADRVAELSEGKMHIEIYPGGVLGTERESVELLQLGSLDLTKVSAAAMEGFVEEYKVFGLPYLFTSKEHAFSVLDGPIGKKMLTQGEKFWLRGLCFYDAGARSFYAANPINHPNDLSGLKIRVMQSPTSVEMINTMGGSPMPITWGELYTALQSGMVNGAENNPPSFYLSHHYEVSRYYSINEHTMIPDVLIMSTHAWNKLSKQESAWLQQAVNESVAVQREEWRKSEEASLAALAQEGVEISYPDKQPFIEAVQDVFNIYRENPKIYNLVQEIRNTPIPATEPSEKPISSAEQSLEQ